MHALLVSFAGNALEFGTWLWFGRDGRRSIVFNEVVFQSMKAELVPENGDPPIPIVRDVTVIGRHESCDIVISAVGLSKRHCVVVRTDGLLVIRDLATTNGTKVKGQRVRWAALLPEDRISLGGYKIRMYLGSDEMPAPSEQRRNGRSRARHRRRFGLRPVDPSVSGNAATERLPKEQAGLPKWNGPGECRQRRRAKLSDRRRIRDRR